MAVLKDVAKEAGTSISVVSNVIRNRGRVSEATRENVLRAVRKVGYRARPNAEKLRTHNGTSRSITTQRYCLGFLSLNARSPVLSTYTASVLSGCQQVCQQRNHLLLTGQCGVDQLFTSASPTFLYDGSADGLIVVGRINAQQVKDLSHSRTPVVLVDPWDRQAGTDCVVADAVRGGMMAADHLIELGHRDIAIVAGNVQHASSAEHVSGIMFTCMQHGCPIANEAIVLSDNFTAEQGYQGTRRLLEGNVPFTAIVTHSEVMATGVYRALQEAGRRVPDDVSLVALGHNAAPDTATAEFTSVGDDGPHMGTTAAVMLLEQLSHPTGLPRQVVCPMSLVQRASTAPRPDHAGNIS